MKRDEMEQNKNDVVGTEAKAAGNIANLIMEPLKEGERKGKSGRKGEGGVAWERGNDRERERMEEGG